MLAKPREALKESEAPKELPKRVGGRGGLLLSRKYGQGSLRHEKKIQGRKRKEKNIYP